MRRRTRMSVWLKPSVALVLVAVSWSIACVSVPVSHRCPRMSEAEVMEFQEIILSGDYPHVEEYMGRLENWCEGLEV